MPQSSDDPVPLGPPPTDADIKALHEAGRRSEAIQAYRLLHGVDLKTAIEAIAARERFTPLTPRARWICAVLLGLGGGLLAYFTSQDDAWRIILGILLGFAVAWKLFSLSATIPTLPRRAPTAPKGPETPPARPSAPERRE